MLPKWLSRRTIIISIGFVFLITGYLMYQQVYVPSRNYKEAISLLEKQEYDKAYSAFKDLGKYKDAMAMANESMYLKADNYEEKKEYELAARTFESIKLYKDSTNRRNENLYTLAKELIDKGQFIGAIGTLEKIGTYKDSRLLINQSKYSQAKEHFEKEEFKLAADLYLSLGTYADSSEQASECLYRDAIKNLNDGLYTEAANIFNKIENYKNVKDYIAILPLLSANVGDIVEFGKMEWWYSLQIRNESIKWVILAKEKDRVLLLSDENISNRPYHSSLKKVTWETCSIRKWLNGEFMEHFTEQEKKLIMVSRLVNQNNPSSGIWGGNSTQDRVFLLSIDEVKKYLPDRDARIGTMRKWDDNNKSYRYNKQGWFLRSVGEYGYYVAYVYADGYVDEYGIDVDISDYSTYSIRPAMWVSTKL